MCFMKNDPTILGWKFNIEHFHADCMFILRYLLCGMLNWMHPCNMYSELKRVGTIHTIYLYCKINNNMTYMCISNIQARLLLYIFIIVRGCSQFILASTSAAEINLSTRNRTQSHVSCQNLQTLIWHWYAYHCSALIKSPHVLLPRATTTPRHLLTTSPTLLPQSLIHLDLSDNPYTLQAASALATSLSSQSNLKHVNLSDTGLEAEGVSLVCAALEKSAGSLEYLGLALNEIGTDGVEDVGKLLRRCKNLKVGDG